MATRYETFLKTVPSLSGCTHRQLRILSRLVDFISVPPGRQVSAPRGEVILVASGETVVLPDASMVAVTAVRLVVVGRREILSLLHEAPDLGRRLLAESGPTRAYPASIRAAESRTKLAPRHWSPGAIRDTEADVGLFADPTVRRCSSEERPAQRF